MKCSKTMLGATTAIAIACATLWPSPGATTQSARSPGAAARPNVLIVTVDTLRADHLSGYGYDRPTSPNIDRLMERGVRFTQARTVEPLTNPALTSLVTSRYPHEHGGSRNGLRVRGGLSSLPKVLQAQGYRTAAFVGNWTLRDKLSGLAEHFEMYDEILTRSRWLGFIRREATADDITTTALDWVADHEQRRTQQPFLVWAHYVEPHAPYRMHKQHVRPLGLEAGKLNDVDRYDTEIAFVDDSIGELLAGFRRSSPESETIVVFASDHGESLGEHKYWGHGRHLYEPTLRVPMSVTWDGHIPPATVAAPALIIDIAPTVLGLLGLTTPPDFEGYDWTDVFGGAKPPAGRVTRYQAHRGAVISSHDSDLRRRAGLLEVGLIHESKKELFRIGKSRREVFDLAADPQELNSIGTPKDRPTEGLMDWMRLVYDGLGSFDDDATPEPLDAESIEQLRSLGYVD